MSTHLNQPTYEHLRINLYINFNIKKKHGIEHTHTQIRTLTHTHVHMNSKPLCHWLQIPFLSFQHQMSNLCASINPNPNHNPSCRTYTYQQTLTLILKKKHKKSREFKTPYLTTDSATIFSLKRCTITLTSKTHHRFRIPCFAFHHVKPRPCNTWTTAFLW